ncbi:MAG TPA: GIY-YIG nuclease family protein, partial [Candidatus Saccharimonadia bacterium]|nr:GIY-YIG nuclease family protein [Candidatus Saccharimonadia bacterium]
MYWFSRKDGKVIYVGKAKNLKRRVSSYAQPERVSGKTLRMVQEATRVQFQELSSELEALLVEAELIRIHQPHYNILLKDDKSPLYVVITADEFPRVLTARKKQLFRSPIKGTVLGPFQSGYSVKQVLKLVRPIFPWCNEKKKTGKPCFYRHIGLCSGACTGEVTAEEYKAMIDQLKMFLRGKTSEVIRDLKLQMQSASELKLYEKAAIFRDQIRMIQEVTTSKRVLGPELHIPQLSLLQTQEMLVRLTRLISTYISLPKTFIFHRIEGYDISNTQGTKPVASMVVFTDGQPDKAEYRMFNIRLGEKPNDYGSLREALTRRQNHPEWKAPDLVLIDGGKGQLRAVISVWEQTTPVVSL